MDYSKFVDEISEKYGYDEELKNAISIAIPLMIEDYGNAQDVLNVFRDVRIFATDDMSRQNRDRIEKEMLAGVELNVIEKDIDRYESNGRDPEAAYSYQTLYDEEGNVTGEIRWMVVKNLTVPKLAEESKRMFGTTIDFPDFLHEAGHAYAMQTPMYSKDGDIIYSKHGMIEDWSRVRMENGQVIVEATESKGIMAEESLNEGHTQKQLMSFFATEDYRVVRDKLDSINHIPSSYSEALVTVAGSFESYVGKESVDGLRRKHDFSVVQKFNEQAPLSEVGQKYLSDTPAYDVLQTNMFNLYDLEKRKIFENLSPEEYGKEQAKFMAEAYVPLCAYRRTDLATYEEVRAVWIPEEFQQGKAV